MTRKKRENGEGVVRGNASVKSAVAKTASERSAIAEGLNGKKVNNEKRAVMTREEPSCDRSFVMVPEELRRLYPNTKPEHIEMALERFSDYECGEGESEIELFGKVLAAVIIDESIGKRGGKHGNS